jgi:hypothetical protein
VGIWTISLLVSRLPAYLTRGSQLALTAQFLGLFELEVCNVLCPIIEADDQLAASTCPTFLRFPDVGICACCRVVLQTAVPCGYCLFDGIARCASVADDPLDFGIARGKDIQPLITTQAELDRDRLPGFYSVECRQVIHRGEEAAEGIGELQLDFEGADVTVGPLGASDAALIGGGADAIFCGIDGGAASHQRHRLGGTAVVLQGTQVRIAAQRRGAAEDAVLDQVVDVRGHGPEVVAIPTTWAVRDNRIAQM